MALEDLKGVIQGLEAQPSWQSRQQFRQINDHWAKAVGHMVARQAKPTSIQRQVLYVSVANGTWAQTLSLERMRILQNLNQYLSKPIKDIRFSAAQWANGKQPNTSNDPSALAAHPSFMQPSGRSASGGPTQGKDKLTVTEAFERWAGMVRSQQVHQSPCPHCQCPCPPGELQRWGTCSLCAAKQWKT
jgi:predicted nucleic acid-binding Zn ribbon protein